MANLSYNEMKDYKYVISYSGRDYQGVIFGNNKARLKSLCSEEPDWLLASIDGDELTVTDCKVSFYKSELVGEKSELMDWVRPHRIGMFNSYSVGVFE